MADFLSKLRSQVSFHLSESEEIHAPPKSPSSDLENGDTEIDEFLLIDDSPFQTSMPSSFQRYPDAPPTYKQVSESDELPSYQSVLSGLYPNISGRSMFASVELSPLPLVEHLPHRNDMSVLSDVPFRLHHSLETKLQARSTFNELDLQHNCFKWSEYSHDFQKEKLCLRDLSSNELANIDEFLIPCSNSPPVNNLPTRNSEVNLMQF